MTRRKSKPCTTDLEAAGVAGGGRGPGFGSGMATTTTTDQSVGNLVIDLFEGSSKQILWRGLATGNLSSNDVRNTKPLDQDIAKMFKTFPPSQESRSPPGNVYKRTLKLPALIRLGASVSLD